MSKKYIKQTNPFIVPTDDGKVIREHFGMATTGDPRFSIAHMIAPSGWSEPYQTPQFDEVTLVFRGRKMIKIDGQEEVVIGPGESILTKAGTRIQYSNPFDEEVEYAAFCVPAFSPDAVNREE